MRGEKLKMRSGYAQIRRYAYQNSVTRIHYMTRIDSLWNHLRFIVVLIVSRMVIIPAALPLEGHAQEIALRFERLTVNDGQSHNTVYTVLQDRLGFVWIGTGNGLNKYNGEEYTIYTHNYHDSTSISDDYVTALHEDEEGYLWVGTRSGGLNVFDRKADRFYRFILNTDSTSTLDDRWIQTIYQDRDGTVWIGTAFAGLVRIDKETGEIRRFLHDSSNPSSLSSNDVTTVHEDRSGRLWVGTWASGLNRLDTGTDAFIRYTRIENDLSSLRSNRIRAVIEDQRGTLWIGTSAGGLHRYDSTTDSFTQYLHDTSDPYSLSDNKVWSLLEDKQGRLWAGTYDGGLNLFDPETERFQRFRNIPGDPSSLAGDVVVTLYESPSGLIWIGNEQGVSIYDPSDERFVLYDEVTAPGHLSYETVLDIIESPSDSNRLWIGTNGMGLCRYDLETDDIECQLLGGRSLEHDGRHVVSTLAEEASGALWIGTKGSGLFYFHPASGIIKQYRHDPDDDLSLCNNIIKTVYIDRHDRLWIGTDGYGLDQYNRMTNTFDHYRHRAGDNNSISDDNISTIFQDNEGILWVGTTDGGLNRFDETRRAFTSYTRDAGNPQTIIHDRVVSIYEDEDGTLWIGTAGGLDRFDRENEVFEHFTVRQGLQSNVVHDVTGDGNGYLWIRTTRGLSKYDQHADIFRHFFIADYYGGNEYIPGTMVLSSQGNLFMGTPEGLLSFSPPTPTDEDYRTPLVVLSLRKSGKITPVEMVSGDTLEVGYDDHLFSIEYALLEYADRERRRYQYMLEGFDDDWRQAIGPIGTASYTNSQARVGTFRFSIMGTSGDGQWSTETLDLLIRPPWWRTFWFQVPFFTSLFGMVVTTGIYSHRKRRKKAQEIKRLLAERREQERQHLARELHDRPLQNLYAVRHLLQDAAQTGYKEESEKSLNQADLVLMKTTDEIRLLCTELRPPVLGSFGLAKAIRSYGRSVQELRDDLDIEYDLMADAKKLPENIRLVLFRIYQGALGNVIRHAQAECVTVRLILESDRVILKVEDDGTGFTVPDDLLVFARRKHFGLLGILEYAESIDGEVIIESNPGQGTRISVTAPLPENNTGQVG